MLHNEDIKEEKSDDIPSKSSMEILSELFSTFHAEPPLIVKKEKSEKSSSKKHKKKNKHKHKDKKHKKKDKKRRRSSSTNSRSSSNGDKFDLAHLLIKQERDTSEKKVKIETIDLDTIKKEKINVKEEKDNEPLKSSKQPPKDENEHKASDLTKTESKGEGKRHKILIKDPKLRSIFESTIHEIKRKVDAEASESEATDKTSKRKCKHKSDRSSSRSESKRDRSKDRHSKRAKLDDSPVKSDRKSKERDKEQKRNKSESSHRDNDFYKGYYKSRTDEERRTRDRSSDRHTSTKSRDRYRDEFSQELEDYKRSRARDNPFYERDNPRRSRERDLNEKLRHVRSYENDYRYRSNSRDRNNFSKFDKKKLLEIARKNAITMMKSGSLPAALTLGPQAQEKVIAAIKSGGKSVEELTDFCKTLSKKEELGELSSLSEKDDSDSDTDKAFHHPFQIKDRPTSITMNIKNSVPLPIKSTLERTGELRLQFPVSSGQQHRKDEDWLPVSPLAAKKEGVVALLGQIPLPSSTASKKNVDISSIVSERLTAIRKLQENPNDIIALTQMYKSNKQDQLQTAAPVSGGMGMHLLQKMGWKPGEGLGKEKTGALEPLSLVVKLDKKGLVATEEQKGRNKKQKGLPTVKTLQGKHPVSLLGEYASKRKLGAPQYILEFECGPDHKKNFLFKVILNGVEYKPAVASHNKKEAKAAAASVCLQQFGLLT